jgi:hypothetical protein
MADYNDRLADYVDVAERIKLFREKHPEGSLQPVDPSKPYDIVTIADKTFIVYIAAAYRTPDDPRPGIGSAWECFPGKTSFTKDSELMNAESSSWGRAILAALAADSKKIATREEVRNRQPEHQPTTPARASQTVPSVVSSAGHPLATAAQINAIRAISNALGILPPAGLDEISKGTATILIDDLKKEQMEQS